MRTLAQRAPGEPYSILVVSPLEWTRIATAKHVQTAIPRGVAYNITQIGGMADLIDILRAENARFTHVFLAVPASEDVSAALAQVFSSSTRSSTSVIVISDTAQKKDVVARNEPSDIQALMKANRLRFIFKPLKPSKLTNTFDHYNSTGQSSEVVQSSAQESAAIQRQVLDEMRRRLGNKGSRVLLVEDNKINQMVLFHPTIRFGHANDH